MDKAQVSANQIIQDIMVRWPQTIPVFLGHRMNCVGCSMSAFELLEDALNIYCLPVESFMEELNSIVERTEVQTK
jgi:hybrid cluster-associated redox disulfide protein